MWGGRQAGEPDPQVHLTREDWVHLFLCRSQRCLGLDTKKGLSGDKD